MHIDDEFQCRKCRYVLSHPVDACPVCSTQIYWMLVHAYPLKKSQIADYIMKMEQLVRGRTSREFLTHGGHLWLPHSFWDFNPNGDALHEFSWIKEVKLLQHEPVADRTDDEKEVSPPVLDTNPGLSITAPGLGTPSRTEPEGGGGSGRDGKKTQPARNLESAPGGGSTTDTDDSWLDHVRVPFMILLFLILLSLSYLILHYHKNTKTRRTVPVSEVVTDEYPILS